MARAVMVTLRAAWLPHAIYCAVGALVTRHSWRSGAYLAAFTIVVYAVEITVSMERGNRFLKKGWTEANANSAFARHRCWVRFLSLSFGADV